MKELEINQKIKECQERKKQYKMMTQCVEDFVIAMERSYETEYIAEYKKMLKELRGK